MSVIHALFVAICMADPSPAKSLVAAVCGFSLESRGTTLLCPPSVPGSDNVPLDAVFLVGFGFEKVSQWPGSINSLKIWLMVIPPGIVGIHIIGILTPTIGLMTIPCYNGNNGSLDPGTYVSCLLCYWCWYVDFYPLEVDLLMCIAMNCCRCCDSLSTCCCWRCPNSLLVDCIGRLGWNHQLRVMEICDYIFCICVQQLSFAFLFSVVCSWLDHLSTTHGFPTCFSS